MKRLAVLIAICGCWTACGGDHSTIASPSNPTNPSTPVAQTFTLSGRITDQQSGRAIGGALVQILDGPDVNKAAISDANGNYTLSGLTVATFTVQASAKGYGTSTQRIDLRVDSTLGLALQISTRTISGTVTDATSRGILPNILIVAFNGPSAGMSTRSDASGNYTLSGVSSDTTAIQASATSYLTSTWSVPIGGDARVNIVMTRTVGTPTPPLPTPTPEPTPSPGSVIIRFTGASGAVASYSESGFSIATTAADWFASSYGKPGPSIQFSTPAGVSTDGEVRITAGGATFQFQSVDLYSSTTPIPYVFTGIAKSATVYVVSGRQGNTFGNFATIASGQSSTPIDTLLIRLTNAAAVCCANPMGLDNIVVR